MEDERAFSPYELYREVQRMRVQLVSLAVELSQLATSIDRVSLVMEDALRLPATQALEAQLTQEAGETHAEPRAAPPLDVETWLAGYIKAVLARAERALTSGEIRKQLHAAVEQRQYCAPNKASVNRALHRMLEANELWCEMRGAERYWSLCVVVEAAK